VKNTLGGYLGTAILTVVLLGIGAAAQRVWVARPFFRVIDKLALWVLLPAIVFTSIAYRTIPEIRGLAAAVLFAFVGLGVCFVLSVIVASAARMDRKMTTAVTMNASFMNVTYLGLPIVYALVGEQGMAPASLYAMAIGVLHLIFGVALASSAAGKKLSARPIILGVLTFPAAFAAIVSLLFVGFKAPPPFRTEMQTALGYLIKPSTVLFLLLVGYYMPIVNPRKYLSPLATAGTIRLLVCPLVTFACMALLGLELGEITPRPALIMSVMPPAVFNVYLAHRFKLDLKLYGAAVFYLTLISLFIALPLMAYLVGIPLGGA